MSEEIVVNDRVSIPRHELVFRASRSGGPGGQHVNTSSTRVELLWDVQSSAAALSPEERQRIVERLAARLDAAGRVRVVASEGRSQRQNRDAAERRMAELVRRALVVRRRRIATKPSNAVREARLDAKRKRSETKGQRRRDFEE